VVALTFRRAGCPHPPAGAVAAAFEAFGRGAAWRLSAGARETLAGLRARRVHVAMVSNYDSRLHRVVEELGLAPLLEEVLASSEVGWAKPSPRIYAAALGRLGVAPGEALMVGDRPREDVEGARAAGLRSLLYDPGCARSGREVIRDLRQVLARVA
jgi:putative hydrolase of the HAD superfamily